jgi:hypothetical protein
MPPGEIFLAQVPFGDVPGMKPLPVLLLTGPSVRFEVLVAYISSVIPTQPLSSDLILDPGEPEFHSTHLDDLGSASAQIGYDLFVEPGAIRRK